ncbi:MAG: heavy-metal-associated domain-containing protein, partial [Alphaproteobacteria bacterium]
HCEASIRSALAERLPGSAVSIDLENHEVIVDGDQAIAEAAIREAGYEPRLA